VVDLAEGDAFGDLLRGQAFGRGHGRGYRSPGVSRSALHHASRWRRAPPSRPGPGVDPAVLHHLRAGEGRTHRVEVLLLGEPGDPFLEIVLERLELLGLEPVLRRAVGARD